MRRTALAALGAVLLIGAGCAVTRLRTAAQLAARSEPLQATPPRPALRLLVVGDSTAVGTGATSPQSSVAGLIARDHPDWQIVNRARDGAKFADIAEQVGTDRHDIVLVMGGGNDVIRLTRDATLRVAVGETLRRAHAVAPEVIVMPAGAVGNAPAFFPPWSWWLNARARDLHRIVRAAAAERGAHYVNLYKDRDADPFVQNADRLNAADGLHPSDAGYALWYDALRAQALSAASAASTARPLRADRAGPGADR